MNATPMEVRQLPNAEGGFQRQSDLGLVDSYADKAAFQIFVDFATDIGFAPNRGSDFGSDRWR
ncbi:protein of unknown function [Nitratireductor aquimarinus]